MSLSIVTPDHATLMVDQPLLLGRHASSDVVLDDPLVSERHAQISPAGSALEVQDLGSTNGTYVNGMRILGPTLVHGGDVIRVGSKDMLVKGLPALAGPGTTGLLLTVRTGPRHRRFGEDSPGPVDFDRSLRASPPAPHRSTRVGESLPDQPIEHEWRNVLLRLRQGDCLR